VGVEGGLGIEGGSDPKCYISGGYSIREIQVGCGEKLRGNGKGGAILLSQFSLFGILHSALLDVVSKSKYALSRTWLDGEFDWGGTPSKV